jgi:hypothetical protein
MSARDLAMLHADEWNARAMKAPAVTFVHLHVGEWVIFGTFQQMTDAEEAALYAALNKFGKFIGTEGFR